MICTVHQPNYVPYCGFFEKAYRSDIFIIYDSTQFKKNDWQNRNRICTKEGWEWLTIPVINKFGQKISETRIDINQKPLKKNWQKLKTIYGKAPYFKLYACELENIYSIDYEKLADLNYDMIKLISKILGLNTKFIKSSDLPVNNLKSSKALLEFCKAVKSNIYLSGQSGKNYIDTKLFEKEKIKVVFQKYNHPEYKQFNSNKFLPNMSVLDLLFNHGPESLKILTSGQNY